MNDGKLIKKYFDFLCKYNFKRKQFTNGSDYEVYYEKKPIEIGVILSWSIPNENVAQYIQGNHYVFPADFDKDKFMKDISSSSSIMSDIIINRNGGSQNLLTCSLFGATELNQLAEDIKNCGKDYEKQLEIYSNFMKNNLEKININ